VQSPAGYFQWSELGGQLLHGYGVYAGDMLSGVDEVRAAWVAATPWTGLAGSSFYRCPRKNQLVGSTATQSRHMYGDAADLLNPNREHPNAAVRDSTWQLLYTLAHVAGATVLDGTTDPACSVACVHVDWR
jgi:hypothetical protein